MRRASGGYRGHTLDLKLTADALEVRSRDSGTDNPPIHLQLKDQIRLLRSGSTEIFHLPSSGAQAKRQHSP